MRTTRPWPPEHVAELRRLVSLHGSWPDIAADMQSLRPGISPDACRVMAGKKGIRAGYRGAAWTPAEDDELERLTQTLTGWSEIAARMQSIRPGASRDAVRSRAMVLGLRDEGEPWADRAAA